MHQRSYIDNETRIGTNCIVCIDRRQKPIAALIRARLMSSCLYYTNYETKFSKGIERDGFLFLFSIRLEFIECHNSTLEKEQLDNATIVLLL
mmetsp:Transcript_34263/g.71678  ORF Transcript_34263/g.71678 Transcript_34263/m.71678 type:complete len:92 (-) Transcript_34263:2113-2388(-)